MRVYYIWIWRCFHRAVHQKLFEDKQMQLHKSCGGNQMFFLRPTRPHDELVLGMRPIPN